METNKVKEKEENIMDIGDTHVVTSNTVVIKEKETITKNEGINTALREEIYQGKMDKEEQNDQMERLKRVLPALTNKIKMLEGKIQ